MKLRTIVKLAVSSSVILLCAGLALYFFFRLSAAQDQKKVDLFELVPATATTVFATEDMIQFVAEIDELSCSKNQHYLHVSKLFSCLKKMFYQFSQDSPHGLSRQMNRLLISFHEPDHERNQVLYCPLGTGDRQLVDKFVRKYAASPYSAKEFEYKGEKILIYPMRDGDFLASYLTSDFLVLSFQKKLIEEVIDAYKNKRGLAFDSSFKDVGEPFSTMSLATVYSRIKGVMGWSEFDMDMDGDFIYFTGSCHGADSCSLVGMLCQQGSLEGVPGEMLPASTYYFSQQRIVDWNDFLLCGDSVVSRSTDLSAEVLKNDRSFAHFLMDHTDGNLLVGLFQREDTTVCQSAAVLAMSVPNVKESERALWTIVNSVSFEKRFRKSRVLFCKTLKNTYPIYRLPAMSLFAQLTGLAGTTSPMCAAFFGEHLLLSTDEESLIEYIKQLEAERVFDGTLAHQTGIASLSESYRLMLMADFGYLLQGTNKQVRYMPAFFLRNAEFFRHFILFAQFTCVDGVVCPHLVLRYRP